MRWSIQTFKVFCYQGCFLLYQGILQSVNLSNLSTRFFYTNIIVCLTEVEDCLFQSIHRFFSIILHRNSRKVVLNSIFCHHLTCQNNFFNLKSVHDEVIVATEVRITTRVSTCVACIACRVDTYPCIACFCTCYEEGYLLSFLRICPSIWQFMHFQIACLITATT